ncbi:hypothetical protein ACFX1R_042369 [Malus domestica]
MRKRKRENETNTEKTSFLPLKSVRLTHDSAAVQPDSCLISASLSPSSTSTIRPPRTHPRGPQASSRRFESRQPTLIPRFQKGFELETLSVISALTVLFLYL